MVFQPGDKVCYPMHGVGTIETIQEQEILGERAQYYVLRFAVGRMTAMVPVKTAANVGLRSVISGEECEKVEAYLQQSHRTETENWTQRYRENFEKLKQGEIYGVADVVKSLVSREREKGLSAGERKMFLTAKQVLLAELAAASGKEEDAFRIILEKEQA